MCVCVCALWKVSHLHGHLPRPGVCPGWLSVHNAWLNGRRNGWFPAGTGPVWKKARGSIVTKSIFQTKPEYTTTYLQLKDKPVCRCVRLQVGCSNISFWNYFPAWICWLHQATPHCFSAFQNKKKTATLHEVIKSNITWQRYPNMAVYMNLFWSFLYFTLNWSNHFDPRYLAYSILTFLNSLSTSGQSLCGGKKNTKKQQGPSIKVSNWSGRSPGPLGLITDWRIRFRWQQARRESEVLGQFTVCSQHITPCFTAHSGTTRRWRGRGGVKKGDGGNMNQVRASVQACAPVLLTWMM